MKKTSLTTIKGRLFIEIQKCLMEQ